MEKNIHKNNQNSILNVVTLPCWESPRQEALWVPLRLSESFSTLDALATCLCVHVFKGEMCVCLFSYFIFEKLPPIIGFVLSVIGHLIV